MKICSKCKIEKELDEFHKNKSACKECRRTENLKYKEKINNRCQNCHKLIKPRVNLCKSCCQLGELNHEFERVRTKEENLSRGLRLENNSNWKGGRYLNSEGYVLVRIDNHLTANKYGYIMEHRLVMERHLGRFLTSEEIVHHKNHKKADNKIENLKLFKNHSEHKAHHDKERQIKNCI